MRVTIRDGCLPAMMTGTMHFITIPGFSCPKGGDNQSLEMLVLVLTRSEDDEGRLGSSVGGAEHGEDLGDGRSQVAEELGVRGDSRGGQGHGRRRGCVALG